MLRPSGKTSARTRHRIIKKVGSTISILSRPEQKQRVALLPWRGCWNTASGSAAARDCMFFTPPGYDQISTPALFLSGAQVALFTTGRGTGIGCALGPVMKIGTNPVLARTYGDIDINAGTILEQKETTEEVGRR